MKRQKQELDASRIAGSLAKHGLDRSFAPTQIGRRRQLGPNLSKLVTCGETGGKQGKICQRHAFAVVAAAPWRVDKQDVPLRIGGYRWQQRFDLARENLDTLVDVVAPGVVAGICRTFGVGFDRCHATARAGKADAIAASPTPRIDHMYAIGPLAECEGKLLGCQRKPSLLIEADTAA